MAYTPAEPGSHTSKTEWIFDGATPRLEFVEYGPKNAPSYKKILWIQFKRHRLYYQISGQLAYDLGQEAGADEVYGYSGDKRIEAYIYNGANPDFVCVQDEYTPAAPYADCTQRTQVWESKAAIADMTWPA